MIDKITAWWERNGLSEKFAVAAVVTVIFTIMYLVVWGIDAVVSWGVNTVGLAWLIRGWTIGSFAYVIIMLWEEYRDYKAEPGVHELFDNEEEELH